MKTKKKKETMKGVKKNPKIIPALTVLIALILGFILLNANFTYLEALNFLNPATEEKPVLSEAKTIQELKEIKETKESKKINGKAFVSGRELNTAIELEIKEFAEGLGRARFMALNEKNDLFVTDLSGGKIFVLTDKNNDGVADEKKVFAEGLNKPHGIYFYKNELFLAEENKISKLIDSDNDLKMDQQIILVSNLPTGGNHATRTLIIKDDKMYLSIGSSCNACVETEKRAMIIQYDLGGSNEKVFAEGLRNSVGIVFHPITGEIWGTDNGRDFLGDDLPPEEVNIIREGQHYGWPYCYGNQIEDKSFFKENFCGKTIAPTVSMQAHSAPLGLRFYEGNSLGKEFNENLFVAFHGSWNRRNPTGYKIVRIRFENELPVVEDFIEGWLVNGERWGRPVDIIFSENYMYISDDFTGKIYSVKKANPGA